MMGRINQLAFYFPFASSVQIGQHRIGFIKIQIKKEKKKTLKYFLLFLQIYSTLTINQEFLS